MSVLNKLKQIQHYCRKHREEGGCETCVYYKISKLNEVYSFGSCRINSAVDTLYDKWPQEWDLEKLEEILDDCS